MLAVGTVAPEIDAVDQDGAPFRLSSLRGRWTVLYFYPKDETMGCTAEACAFRDNLGDLVSEGAEVVGVSTQDQASHRAFASHHGLTFRLVADPDRRIAKAYDTLGILGLSRRITYLIDPSGTIRDAYRSELDPRSHVERMKERLRVLRQAGP